MEFEKYIHTGRTNAPKITAYHKTGRIVINTTGAEKLGLTEDHKHVCMFFNRDSYTVGFEFLKEPVNGSMKVAWEENKSAVINGNPFFAALNINLQEKNQSAFPDRLEDSKIVVMKLVQPE
jgi:hypothetical protein